MIECTGIGVRFGTGDGEVWAVREVDLTVARGEAVFIVGPSGSGKTTLLSVIGTLLAPTTGVVRVAGEDVLAIRSAELPAFRLRHIGFVFQEAHLLSYLTAAENVMVPMLAAGLNLAEARARAEELLDRVGLAHRPGNKPDTLSGGEKQRVAVARALANRPSVILADEPTASLDSQAGQQVMKLIWESGKEIGAAVVVVTHDPRIMHMADRVIRMEDGRVVVEKAC